MTKEELIKELVEWVAKTIYDDWGCSKWESLMDREKETWRKTATSILSHKDKNGNSDLALIDTTPMANVSYLPVVRLAEALKEVNNV
ncbi:hypothetical protein LCGC14_0598970 [marine sediment metagenome]|uniref:Uncharacterized protein n=1 Tax=marine sediment metagenome TaxID=412755 RepID=A0A0F9RG62_9ZZZZ